MNVLIIDDEPLIHCSIEFIIDRFHYEDVHLLHAYNATEMMAQLQAQKIELVLVDIRLPGSNGLSAIALAKKTYPDALYFVMSGYSEFDYAREAIRVGVEEYLLKPLDEATLRRVLDSVNHKRKGIIELREDIIRGWVSDAIAGRECHDEPLNGYMMATVYVTDDGANSSEGRFVPKFDDRYSEHVVSYPTAEGTLLMLYFRRPDPLSDMLIKLKSLSIPELVTIYVTRPTTEPNALKGELHTMLEYSGLRVLLGVKKCYQVDDVSSFGENLLDYAKQCLYWKDCYHAGDCLSYLAACPSVYQPIAKKKIPCQYIEHVYNFVASVLGMETNSIASPQALLSAMEYAANNMIQKQSTSSKIDMILDYINDNFYSDISVASISEKFGLTPNYLSTLLKNKLNKKFADYIAELRISYAKDLLKATNLRVKDIMEKVGYYSQSYFSKLFIDIVGMTPSEYRKKYNPNE